MTIDNMKLLLEFKHLATNAYIHIFLAVILFDILTGITKGFASKQANSTKGLFGVVKHLLIVLLVLTSYPYLVILNLGYFATTCTVFYIAVYGISILENLSALGLPFPTFIKSRLEKIKDTADKVK